MNAKHIGLFACLLLLALGCKKLEKANLYYYYSGEKIYLDERQDMLFLLFEDGLSDTQKQDIVQSDSALHPWRFMGKTVDGSGGSRYAVLVAGTRIPQTTVNKFLNIGGTKAVSYMCEYEGTPMAATNKFSVMLKGTTSLAQVEDLAKRYGCAVGQEEWAVSGVYVITVPKTVSMGTVRLSCLFYETGLFEWTSPDFIAFGNFFYAT